MFKTLMLINLFIISNFALASENCILVPSDVKVVKVSKNVNEAQSFTFDLFCEKADNCESYFIKLPMGIKKYTKSNATGAIVEIYQQENIAVTNTGPGVASLFSYYKNLFEKVCAEKIHGNIES